MLALTASLLLTLLAPQSGAQEASADWPHWLGPERNGISRESGWSPTGAAEPLWRAELGLGYANVSISGGRLFTSSFDETLGEDVIWCLDAETGEELWVRPSAAQNLARFHGGGTLSTPSVEGDRVYVANRFGKLVCLSVVDGALLWERDYAEEWRPDPVQRRAAESSARGARRGRLVRSRGGDGFRAALRGREGGRREHAPATPADRGGDGVEKA